MKKKFFTNYDLKELKPKLSLIIEDEDDDAFKTHFSQIFFAKHDDRVTGYLRNESFKLWVYDSEAAGSTGIFYPTIKGNLIPRSQGTEIQFSSKMNVIGRTVFLTFNLILSFGILTEIVIQETNELKYLIPRALMGMFLLGLVSTAPLLLYFRTLRIRKTHLINELKLSHQR
ncbi:hypothetical protein [uncultured Roseivirga sp.]|uniref:hypothetical protein n=1 Tax=uncultured Roseivirga sp. TaxID=543088 RepID=UPI0030DA9016|tara:strand:- start:3631 stop:4146 length:516 start_codon:yes stop_codon:yes gene_type:complete